MIITRATADDLDRLLLYRREASEWLWDQGIDQWRNPFPHRHILASIEAGSVFMVRDGAEIAATVTLDDEPEPDLWTEDELEEPCLHLHKLIVLRSYSGQGLGRRIIDWACDRTAARGGRWVRINTNTANTKLQEYYLRAGFDYVRTVAGGGVGGAGVAGWLAQHPAVITGHGLEESSDVREDTKPLVMDVQRGQIEAGDTP